MFGYGGRFNGYSNGIGGYQTQNGSTGSKRQKWYKPENEKQEKAFKRCKGDLKALLVASKEGISAKGCYKQLCELIEDDFTYQDCGLKTMGEFLFHCDDIMEVRTDGYQGYYLFLKSSAAGELEDLRRLVQGQQNSKSGYKGFKAKTNNTYWVHPEILLDVVKYTGSASFGGTSSAPVQNKYHQNNPKGSGYRNRNSGGGGRSSGYGSGSSGKPRFNGFSAPRFQNGYRSRETPTVSPGLKNAVMHALGEDNFDNDNDDADFDDWEWSSPSLNTKPDKDLEELMSRFTIGKPITASSATSSTISTTKSSAAPLMTTARINTTTSSTARPYTGTGTLGTSVTTKATTAKPLTRPTFTSGRFAANTATTTVKQEESPQQSPPKSTLEQRTVTGSTDDSLKVTVNNIYSSGNEQPAKRQIRNPFVLEAMAKADAARASNTSIHTESVASSPPKVRPIEPATVTKTEVTSATTFVSKNLVPTAVQRAISSEVKPTASSLTPQTSSQPPSSAMNRREVSSVKKNVRRVVEFRQIRLNQNVFHGNLLGVDAYGFAYFNLVDPHILEFHEKSMAEIQAFYAPAEIQAAYKCPPEDLKPGLLIIIKQNGKFMRAKIFSILKYNRECICYDLEEHEIYQVPFDNIFDIEDQFTRKLPHALMCILEGTEDYLLETHVSQAFEATPMDPPEVILKVVDFEDNLFGLPVVKMTHRKSGKDVVNLLKTHGAEFFENVSPRPQNALTEHQIRRKTLLEDIMYIPS